MTTLSKPNSPKVAVIGAGYWGKNLVRNFVGLNALAAICDPAPEAASLAAQYDIPHKSLEDVLSDAQISGVVIATPAATHAKLARRALLENKHVFVEKPLALDLKEASALGELAKAQKRQLMVGHLMQYHPAFIKLLEMVNAGRLGRIYHIDSMRLNFGKIRREEDILWSFAPHDISMILKIVGSAPMEVTANGAYHLHESIADLTTTYLKFPDGVSAQIYVSWLHPFKEQKMVVIGERGMLVFSDNQDWEHKLQFYPHEIEWRDGAPLAGKAPMQPVPVTPGEPLKRECQHFIECIQKNESPLTSHDEGLAVLKVLHQASLALRGRAGSSTPAETQNPNAEAYVHESACIDANVSLGQGTKVWHFTHIMSGTTIGREVTIGQNVMIGPEVTIGARCKIQNNVSVYNGVTLEEGVFCGPSCVFTNVNTPRAEIEQKSAFLPTTVRRGATIGANATIVCGHELGAYCFIAAGAVVTQDVPPYALMAGVPAKQIGWVSRTGKKLTKDLKCPDTGEYYQSLITPSPKTKGSTVSAVAENT